jgi:hypothetical protein
LGGRSTEYIKYSKIILKDGFEYSSTATNAGNEGGMEISWNRFCSWESKGEDLGVTDHEFGQTGFL